MAKGPCRVDNPKWTVGQIVEAVAAVEGIDVKEIRTRRRFEMHARRNRVIAYIAREEGWYCQIIGNHIDRDAATARDAADKARQLLSTPGSKSAPTVDLLRRTMKYLTAGILEITPAGRRMAPKADDDEEDSHPRRYGASTRGYIDAEGCIICDV